ncbi:MAG: hypothetical protein ACNA76_03250 [Anaerosomatales bacterium]
MSDDKNTERKVTEVQHTTVVDRGGGGPFTIIIVVIVVAVLVFGAWWLFMRGDAAVPESGDNIEIEQDAPDVNVDIQVPGTGEDVDESEEPPAEE